MNRPTLLVLVALVLSGCRARPVPLADPPDVRARQGLAELTLTAAGDARGAIRGSSTGAGPAAIVSRQATLKIHYVNALPVPRERDAGVHEHDEPALPA